MFMYKLIIRGVSSFKTSLISGKECELMKDGDERECVCVFVCVCFTKPSLIRLVVSHDV